MIVSWFTSPVYGTYIQPTFMGGYLISPLIYRAKINSVKPIDFQPFIDISKLSSWWFSTHLINISQIGSFPQVVVKINKYLKPPPSYIYNSISNNSPIAAAAPTTCLCSSRKPSKPNKFTRTRFFRCSSFIWIVMRTEKNDEKLRGSKWPLGGEKRLNKKATKKSNLCFDVFLLPLMCHICC